MPVDLGESDMTELAIGAATAQAKGGAGDAEIRLINVQPLVPIAFVDYIPPNFDDEIREGSERDLKALAGKVDLRRAGLLHRALWRGLSRGAGGGGGLGRRSHCRRLASSDHVDLSPRLQRDGHRAPRQMLGAGRAQIRRSWPLRIVALTVLLRPVTLFHGSIRPPCLRRCLRPSAHDACGADPSPINRVAPSQSRIADAATPSA